MTEETRQKIYVRVNPFYMQLIAMGGGFVLGFLLVALDPWLRFADVPARINYLEALLTGIVLGGYGGLIAWMVTTFWRSPALWLVVLMTAPLVTGVLAFWNEINAVLASATDLIYLLPVVLILHGVAVLLTVLFLHMARQTSARVWLAFLAVPVVLGLNTVLVLGRVRWNDFDAKDVMHGVHRYVKGLGYEDYRIEYLGMDYYSGAASVGMTRVYTDDGTLICEARLFTGHMEVSCDEEDQ